MQHHHMLRRSSALYWTWYACVCSGTDTAGRVACMPPPVAAFIQCKARRGPTSAGGRGAVQSTTYTCNPLTRGRLRPHETQ